ncbi:MAG: hypothetical protein WD271_11390 [Acidimicrobiia bacterium]
MARAARCALALVSVLLPLVFTPSPAVADEITGGCTGTANGKDATLLTRDDPLVVHEGEQLTVSGNIPTEFAAANPPSTTTVKVSVVDGLFGISTDAHESTGATYSADTVELDDYFNVGVGLYRVDVVNSGLGWRCEYTGYIKLDGDPLSKPAGLVALAAVVIGAVGVMFTKGRKPKEPGWVDAELNTADQIEREEAWQTTGRELPDAVDFQERGSHAWLPAGTLRANERLMWSGKVRLHGHPVAAFFWGLLLGLGIGLLGWQDGRWTVNLGSIVLFPLVIAAAAALFGWFGWGYRTRDVAVLPADSEESVREPIEAPTSVDALDSEEVPRSEEPASPDK